MRTLSAILATTLTAGILIAQTATKTPAKAPPPKAAKSKVAAAKAAPPKRYVQTQPTPERYKEIQQSLADRGYFDGPVDGNWRPQSVDALKRFQHDQELEEDGKIGSRSLIRLGLGPQRTASAPAAQEPPR